jgi:hypothetical protein
VKVLILRVHFSAFRPIFTRLGRFWEFSGAIFPVFVIFRTWAHGILANQTRGRTIAHRQQELKPRNWAPKLTVFYFVYLGLKPLVSFGPIGVKYSREV